MTAQTHPLFAVPDPDERTVPVYLAPRVLRKAMLPLPLWKALRQDEADRRHRALVQLEAMYRETPWYMLRLRWSIRRTIAAHLPSMWS